MLNSLSVSALNVHSMGWTVLIITIKSILKDENMQHEQLVI